MTALTLALLLCQDERMLFDFKDPAELAAWSSPDVKIELADGLKLTFAGGAWPAASRALPNEDWMPYHRLTAEVVVERECLVGLAVLQEKSLRGGGWDSTISRWTKTQVCRPGRNVVSDILHRNDWQAIVPKYGPVTRFEIFLYNARPGESIRVDRVRLSKAKDREEAPKREFKVLGTDLTVSGVRELGQKLASTWTKPEPRTVEEVEAEFRAAHPKATIAVFRDGENGYAGWRDAYFNSHGPDGMTVERAQNFGSSPSREIFMRHRSPLMKVDLSSLPKGAKILGARLIVTRADKEFAKGHNPEEKPSMWVVEPCARPWVEGEVNAYEYAKDRFWKAIGGQYYGEDPDFWPVYIAHGPSRGKVCWWDFTEAVRFWTVHENHGFMLHGDSHDWMGRACYREWPEVKQRPAVLVAYLPQ